MLCARRPCLKKLAAYAQAAAHLIPSPTQPPPPRTTPPTPPKQVNPRVQVEHTVTEEVTGVDIVQAQIKIAGGATLASLGLGSQADVPPPSGFAIQCRVTSEDPEQAFQPDSGRLEAFRVPGGPGIRLDGAVTAGNVISRHYDSLLSKVIVTAPTFSAAVQRMARALSEFQVRAGGGGVERPTLSFLVCIRMGKQPPPSCVCCIPSKNVAAPPPLARVPQTRCAASRPTSPF